MKKRRLWLVACLIFSLCMCFCLVACNDRNGNDGDNDDKKPVIPALTAPTVTIDGNGIATWDEIANASGYAFKINDGAEQTAESREVTLENGQTIAVKATGDGATYSDSAWSKAVTYTAAVDEPVKLSAPVVAIAVDGTATWTAIANASEYIVKIDEKQTATDLTSAALKNGETIAVRAVGDGISYLTGDFSSPKTYRAPVQLAAPENPTVAVQGVDAGKVIFKWDEVAGASGYRYVVNGDEKNAATVMGNSATVDLSEIDGEKLDSTWVFQVRALAENTEDIADDGDYSDYKVSSDYCEEVEFAVSNDEIYTAVEIIKIMNYYGDELPDREFMIAGAIESNADDNAVLEGGFTLFGKNVPELDLAVENRLAGLDVTAIGTLKTDGKVKGLSCYRSSVDFEGVAENDRYALVIDALNAWDILQEGSRIMGDFYLPVKLYGVNIMWSAIVDETGAFEMDEEGNVTVTCPKYGEDNIWVMLTADMLYVDDDHIYDGDELSFMFEISPDTRTPLDAPKINIDPKTGVATWNKIEHATGYKATYYGFSIPGNYNSDYVSEEIVIPADGKRAVQLKDTWWITVQALGDSAAYADSDVNSKQYNYYPETVEPDGTPLEFDLTKLTQTGELANANYIFGLACGNADVFESASATRVVLGNDDVNGAITGTGFIKVGSASNDGKITLNFNKKILGVVITARQWDKDEKDKISVNGSDAQTASKNDWGVMYFNFTASKASTTIEIVTDNRVFINSIVVYVAD